MLGILDEQHAHKNVGSFEFVVSQCSRARGGSVQAVKHIECVSYESCDVVDIRKVML